MKDIQWGACDIKAEREGARIWVRRVDQYAESPQRRMACVYEDSVMKPISLYGDLK